MPAAKQKVTCPYCGADAEYRHSSVVYGDRGDYGYLYVCANYPRCDAYVGVHKGTYNPLGRMANAELRRWKGKAHKAFDVLWRRKMAIVGCSKKVARGLAYHWLSKQLGISERKCHIGMFDVAECKQVVDVCGPYLGE